MAEREKVRANTTVSWTRTISGYSGYTATYRLFNSSLPTITFTATADGGTYEVDVKPATTGEWAAGIYNWLLTVSNGTDTYEVDSGTIEVLAEDAADNPLMAAQARLQAAETEYEARVTGKASEFTIKDRSLKRMTAGELKDAIGYYRQRVNALKAEEARRRGSRAHNNVSYARFS